MPEARFQRGAAVAIALSAALHGVTFVALAHSRAPATIEPPRPPSETVVDIHLVGEDEVPKQEPSEPIHLPQPRTAAEPSEPLTAERPRQHTRQDTEERIQSIRDQIEASREEQAAEGGSGSQGEDAASRLCTLQRDRYLASDLGARVRAHWAFPMPDDGLQAHVAIRISREGSLVAEPTVTLPSGDRAFDASVMRAVRKASPFPPPPSCLEPRTLRATFVFSPEAPESS